MPLEWFLQLVNFEAYFSIFEHYLGNNPALCWANYRNHLKNLLNRELFRMLYHIFMCQSWSLCLTLQIPFTDFYLSIFKHNLGNKYLFLIIFLSFKNCIFKNMAWLDSIRHNYTDVLKTKNDTFCFLTSWVLDFFPKKYCQIIIRKPLESFPQLYYI